MLLRQGHERGAIDVAIQRALATIEREASSPAQLQAKEHAKTGRRLLRLGVMWLFVEGLASLYWGAGVLSYLAVVGVGAGLLTAGIRNMKRSDIRRTDF